MSAKPEIRRAEVNEGESRVETGPLQLGDDWPGFFMRGDEVIGTISTIHLLLRAGDKDPVANWPMLKQLLESLEQNMSTCLLVPSQLQVPEGSFLE